MGLIGGWVKPHSVALHDGDTVTVRAASPDPEDITGNVGVRFLGIDTPEVSLPLPGRAGFTPTDHQEWKDFLADPFSEEWAPFDPPLDSGLLEYLRSRIGEEAAMNHRAHAKRAEDALEQEMEDDMGTLGKTPETFRLYLSFAHEVMDRYGRFLAYLNRLQPDEIDPEPRPDSYNERLLEAGVASPYFIWPSVDPFREPSSLAAAVPEPRTASRRANGNNALAKARAWVRAARDAEAGVFSGDDPLLLQAFELRFLSRQSTVEEDGGEREVRRPPDRWVIDLSKEEDVLLPQHYHAIPFPENRLFVPAEFVPLFLEHRWRRGADGR
jgi:endonuclease YncB( thermonuclease family)